MKYILIGDIHGRTNWKQIVEKEKDADKFIFFGDYFDPYDWSLSLNEIVNNFNDILEFKNKNPNKVILLILFEVPLLPTKDINLAFFLLYH